MRVRTPNVDIPAVRTKICFIEPGGLFGRFKESILLEDSTGMALQLKDELPNSSGVLCLVKSDRIIIKQQVEGKVVDEKEIPLDEALQELFASNQTE